jgi:hypothetical protein
MTEGGVKVDSNEVVVEARLAVRDNDRGGGRLRAVPFSGLVSFRRFA